MYRMKSEFIPFDFITLFDFTIRQLHNKPI